MTKNIVIYHKDCADGFAAAWCFWRYCKENNVLHTTEFHAASYGTPPPIVTDKLVYLVDFSYKREIVREMAEEAFYIMVLDHHKSALEDLKGLNHPRVNLYNCTTEKSGAGIAWDFLFPNRPAPTVLQAIQDRDLWQFKRENTKEITAAVFAHDYDFDVYDSLMYMNYIGLYQLIDKGKWLIEKFNKDVQALINTSVRYQEIAGYLVPMANVPAFFASEVCSILCQDYPFAAAYYDSKMYRNFSLRSKDTGIDVSEIAKQFGGGGHRNASGFKVARTHYLAQV
jgi:uncharacterized protein